MWIFEIVYRSMPTATRTCDWSIPSISDIERIFYHGSEWENGSWQTVHATLITPRFVAGLSRFLVEPETSAIASAGGGLLPNGVEVAESSTVDGGVGKSPSLPDIITF